MSACEISYTTTTKWPNLFFFALIVHESWFPILEIQPSPDFFHRDSAQPFGVKWSKFSQEPRTATELEMVVSCLISPSSSVLPPSPMCMSPLLSWLFKGWLHCSGFELSLPGTFEWVCACQEGAGRAVSFNPRQMENFDMGDARMKLYGHIAAGNKTRQSLGHVHFSKKSWNIASHFFIHDLNKLWGWQNDVLQEHCLHNHWKQL